MYYVGVDHHKRTSYMTIMDERGRVVKHGNLVNRPEVVEAFLGAVEGEMSAVIEAGPNWPVMYDWLSEMIESVTLAHPSKVRVIAEAKIKSDRLDSKVLAHLLRADLIPAAYAPDVVTRDLRRQIRQRMFMVHMASAVKNRIHAVVDRHPGKRQELGEVSDLFGKAGREWLKKVEIPEADKKLLHQDIVLLSGIEAQIKISDRWVSQMARKDDRAVLLKSIPGIGDFFAVLIALEIDDIKRFSRPSRLAAYAGLVPSTYASGNYVHHGRITKQGNKWLRWACIEAVYPAIRKDEGLRELYERLKVAKGANVAKVAVARRILTICYRVLSEEREYRPWASKSFRLP